MLKAVLKKSREGGKGSKKESGMNIHYRGWLVFPMLGSRVPLALCSGRNGYMQSAHSVHEEEA